MGVTLGILLKFAIFWQLPSAFEQWPHPDVIGLICFVSRQEFAVLEAWGTLSGAS